MQSRTRAIWACVFVLPLAIACGGSDAGMRDREPALGGSGGTTDDRPAAIPGSVGTGGAGGDRQTVGAGNAEAFVAAMLADGQSEVALSRLATERAANARVKAFAEGVAADHARANDELTALAARFSIKADPPDPAHQSAQDRLSQLKGGSFDREYLNVMVTSHQAAVDQLTAMAGTTPADRQPSEAGAKPRPGAEATGDRADDRSDAQAVQAWAAKATPIVQAHLQQARDLQRALGSDASAR